MADFVECQVALPPGTQPGAKLMIQIDTSGRKYQIVVPPGARGGQTIRVRVPKPSPVPQNIVQVSQNPYHQPRPTPNYTASASPPQNNSTQLWHGWFFKQQPHFPHGWQRRYGSITPRSSNRSSYELIYYSSDTDMRSGKRRGSLPLSWPEHPSGQMGRICLDGPPTREGKVPFLLRTPVRDFNLSFGPSLSSAAEFYLCYRVFACGDSSDLAKKAIFGSNQSDPNMMLYRLQTLHTEQCRIEAMGLDKFEAAASLIQCGGDGNDALTHLLAESARRNGITSASSASTGPGAASSPPVESPERQQAQRDLEQMGFSAADATLAVSLHGIDTEAAMMWLVQRNEAPAKIEGERYELSFDDGPLGVKVTTGNDNTGNFPVVRPSPEGSHHIACDSNAHLPRPGHLVEAYSVQGGPWKLLTGTIDERYDDCISAAMGPRPVSFRLIAVDGVGLSNEAPSSPSKAASCWEYQMAGGWHAYPPQIQSRLNAAVQSGASCVAGISLKGTTYNLFVDSMTQFNTATNEFTAMRHPTQSTSQQELIPPLNDLTLNAAASVSAPPILDFEEPPMAPPVLMAHQSDEGASDDGGMALFATLLSGEEETRNDAERAECSVCFEDLCAEPVALFFNAEGGRVCQHFFHHECACELPTKVCPLCNREFDNVKELPDALDAPKQWFAMVDHVGNGTLDRRDVVEALKAQLPIKTDRLEAHFDDLWRRWDTDGSGDLSLDELFNPKNGLLEYLKMANERTSEVTPAQDDDLIDFFSVTGLNEISPSSSSAAAPPAPALTMETRVEWFHHFDGSRTGHLDANELLLAINSCGGRVDSDTVAMLMMTCDLRNEGRVSEDEFLRSGGVAEVLIASLGL